MAREGTSKFGWCLTGHCHDCPGTSVSGKRCSCEHHEKKEEGDGTTADS